MVTIIDIPCSEITGPLPASPSHIKKIPPLMNSKVQRQQAFVWNMIGNALEHNFFSFIFWSCGSSGQLPKNIRRAEPSISEIGTAALPPAWSCLKNIIPLLWDPSQITCQLFEKCSFLALKWGRRDCSDRSF